MLSCSEGGKLESKDIMIEVTDFGPFDTNCKDLHVRVWAHDYPSRRGPNNKSLDLTQLKLSGRVRAYLTPDISWNVWVLLATTSYGSDTTDRVSPSNTKIGSLSRTGFFFTLFSSKICKQFFLGKLTNSASGAGDNFELAVLLSFFAYHHAVRHTEQITIGKLFSSARFDAVVK